MQITKSQTIILYTVLFFLSIDMIYSYPFENIPISTGNRQENFISTKYNLLNSKLSFIYSSSSIKLTGIETFQYELEDDNETIYAPFWIASYKGVVEEEEQVRSFTFYQLTNGSAYLGTWSEPMLFPNNTLKFLSNEHLEITDSVFKIFYSSVKANSPIYSKIISIVDWEAQSCSIGAGYLDTIQNDSEIIKSIATERPICFVLFKDVKSGAYQFCYAYIDTPQMVYDFGTANIKENKLSSSLIFPNPASSNIELSGELIQGTEIMSIIIYDLNGNIAKEISTSMLLDMNDNCSIDISDLSDGAYTIVIRTIDNHYVEKLIISK